MKITAQELDVTLQEKMDGVASFTAAEAITSGRLVEMVANGLRHVKSIGDTMSFNADEVKLVSANKGQATGMPVLIPLTNNRILIIELGSGGTQYTRAYVGFVNGNQITFGPYTQLFATTYQGFGGFQVSDNRVLLYRNTGGVVAICFIDIAQDGTVSAPLGATQFSAGTVYDPRGIKLTDTKFVFCYRDGTTESAAFVADWNGDLTLAFGPKAQIRANSYKNEIARINDGAFIAACTDGALRTYTVAGNVITLAQTLSGYATGITNNTPKFVTLQDSKFGLAFDDSAGAEFMVVTVDGAYNIAIGAKTNVSSTGFTDSTGGNTLGWFAAIDETSVAMVIVETGVGYFTRMLKINGTTVTVGDRRYPLPKTANVISHLYIIKFSGDKVIIGWVDGTDKAVYVLPSRNIMDYSKLVGVAKQSVAAGAQCKVAAGQIVTGLAGLEQGQAYYGAYDGVLTKTKTGFKFGVATAADKLISKPYETTF